MFTKAILLVLVPLWVPLVPVREAIPDVRLAPPVAPPIPKAIADADVTVEIAADGSFKIGGVAGDVEAVEKAARQALAKNPGASLRVRADRDAPVRALKQVTKAAGKGGITRVIFSARQKNPAPSDE